MQPLKEEEANLSESNICGITLISLLPVGSDIQCKKKILLQYQRFKSKEMFRRGGQTLPLSDSGGLRLWSVSLW